MSTLNVTTIIPSEGTNTDLDISGKGTGVPNLEAGFKVGGSAGVPTASIQDDAITSAKIADDAVVTAAIADDAITLATMASGTDGVIITYDASGNPVHVGPGSDGQVLTSTGAGSPPAFEDAAGGGAWTLIGTQAASSSAALTQTGLSSTYDTYAVALSDIHPATDGADCRIRLGDSGGVDSGGSDYSYINVQSTTSGYSQAGSTGNSAILFGDVGSGAGEGAGGLLWITQPSDSQGFCKIIGTMGFNTDSGAIKGGTIFGQRNSVITFDRIEFSFNSGNVATGRMTVWGISHA